MKIKITLLSILFYPLFGLTAQTESYSSYFGETFAEWYIHYEFIDLLYSEMYKTEKEEIVLSNGLTYYSVDVEYDPQFSGGVYAFAMREDLSCGALYLNVDGQKEILVSTMDLKIGDKFYFPEEADMDFFSGFHQDNNGYYTVVQDIYFEENRKHILMEAICVPFLTAYEPYSLIFIEGIGPNCSFVPFIEYSYFTISLICYDSDEYSWKLDRFWESWGSSIECLFWLTGIPVLELDKTHPFMVHHENSLLKVTFNIPSPSGQLNLYSIDGKLHFSRKIKGDSVVEISTATIPPGNYFLHYADPAHTVSESMKVLIRN